jgi:hypothetical protein
LCPPAEEDRQVTPIVTVRPVRLITFALEKQYVYTYRVCACILNYSACNARAPYFIVVCGLSRTTIFFHVVIKGAVCGK